MYYGMSYGRAIIGLCCQHTCNQNQSLVLSVLYASTCTAISTLCHKFHTLEMLMNLREINGRKRFTRIYLWYSSDTCGSCHTFHPIPSPVRHYGLCVYSHVHIQPAVLGRRGMGECHAVLLPINTSPVYFTYNVHPPDSVLHTL